MKYTKYLLCALVLLMIFTMGYTPRKIQKNEYILDTIISLTIYGKNANEACESILDELERIDAVFSCHNKDSEISKINASASDNFIKTTEEVFSLIEHSVLLSTQTDGAFDITLKPLSDIWKRASESKTLPNEEEIKNALSSTGYQNIVLDKKNCAIFFSKENMAIDLGDIAKGYAADRAMEILKEHKIENAIIDLGGNVAVLGARPLSIWESIKNKTTTLPFVVGIQSPDGERGDIIQTLTPNSDSFIITSGDYERFFEIDGKKYHHIIDPSTGWPSESGIKSATIVSANGATGDALSTAVFVRGTDGADKLKNLCKKIVIVDNTQNVLTYERN